jgi:hypothetical protein
MVTIPELAADYHRTDIMRKDLDQRIRTLPHDDIIGRDLLLVAMDAVLANLDEAAGRLAAIPARDMNDLRVKAAVLIAAQDREADVTALSLGLANDVINL